MSDKILIDSHNPYEFWFPGRKFVGRDTLRLIKYLRQAGHEVVVKPDDGKPFEYLFQKGIKDIFSDPIYIQLIAAGSTLITTLIANAIQKVIDGSKKKSLAEKNIVININNVYYNIDGQKILEGGVKDKKKKYKKLQEGFQNCLSMSPPYPSLAVPILLEHKPVIVGWCSLQYTIEALEIRNSKILDKNVLRKIEKGKIKGASMTGVAMKAICSICERDYVDCIHISGEVYEGSHCMNDIHEAIPIELSFVKEPVNTACILEIVRANR